MMPSAIEVYLHDTRQVLVGGVQLARDMHDVVIGILRVDHC